MSKFASFFRTFIKDEEGASLVEYALLVALIALACVVALTATGTSISDMFTRINNKLSTVAT
jgi:pilus assembly protein Flp/PilA